jgi:hypothetical protein
MWSTPADPAQGCLLGLSRGLLGRTRKRDHDTEKGIVNMARCTVTASLRCGGATAPPVCSAVSAHVRA